MAKKVRNISGADVTALYTYGDRIGNNVVAWLHDSDATLATASGKFVIVPDATPHTFDLRNRKRIDPISGEEVEGNGMPVYDSISQRLQKAAGLSAAQVEDLRVDGFVELLGSYITVEANMPSSVSRMKGQSFGVALNNSHIYVDSVNGNDANSGQNPSQAKKTLKTANWTGSATGINPHMFVLLARGSEFICDSLIGNSGSGFTGGGSLGSYGDPRLPKPIVRGVAGSLYAGIAGLNFADPDGACLMDVSLDFSGLDTTSGAPVNGVRFATTTNGDVFRNVIVSGVDIRPPRHGSTGWAAGLTLYKRTNVSSSAAVPRSGPVRVEGCKIYGGGSHGMIFQGALGYQMADGTWGGVEALDNEVIGCGLDYDSHGITAYADNVVYKTNVAWTLVSGTTYYCVYSTEAGRSVGDVELCNILHTSNGGGCTINLERNTSTPTAPAVGEFGFDNGTQRLYINAGAAVTTADTLLAATQPPRGLLYAGNTVSDMAYNNNTPAQEGHGLVFDDWVSDSVMYGNRSLRNGGMGMNTNKGSRNRFLRNYAEANRLGGVGISGLGAVVEGNVLIGGSARTGGFAGLINQDLNNGAQGGLAAIIRRNLMIATGNLDAFIAQSDVSGFRGSYSRAALNRGFIANGANVPLLTKGKVMGF